MSDAKAAGEPEWPPRAPTVVLRDRALVVSFPAPVRACSWAIVGGGLTLARHVVWIETTNAELNRRVDPRAFVRERLRAERIEGATVALLTSRKVAAFEQHVLESAERVAYAVATVGLSNALRAGDPAGPGVGIGTINLLVHVPVPLTDEALLEASAIATEAKAAAVLEAGVRSRVTGRAATGTGTDCTVITCATSPVPDSARVAEPYAGKHTPIGALIGAAALHVVSAGVRHWKLGSGSTQEGTGGAR